MPRFFYPFPLVVGAEIELPDALAHHVSVLRLAIGAQIVLFNGEGGEHVASVTSIEKKRVRAEIKTFSPHEVELPYAIELAQALPEGTKMDWIIEKAVELGVTAIVPIASQRCVVRLSADRAVRKVEHWQGVVTAASEQCGRNRLAHLASPTSLRDWLGQQNMHTRILFSPRAEQTLSDWARHQTPQALSLLIGPEGGFSREEEDLALKHGVITLSLGPRVLRTETAGMAAVSALNGLWGQL